MPRLNQVTNDQADEKSQQLLSGVQKKLGTTPNIMRVMANSPAVLDAYLQFSGTLAKGALSSRLREQIALAVGEANSCDYCLAAHSAIGRQVGLKDEEIADSRRAVSSDPKTSAALAFARKVVAERGNVSDADVDGLRAAGFADGSITEIVANVALNIFTNYVNHVADTEIDFPKAQPLTASAACAC